jgi:ABC-2 type transport system permease protein
VRNVRVVFIGGVISYRALFQWTRPASFVCSLLIMPVSQLLFFVFLGRALAVADDRFYILGNVMLAASGACVMGGTMAIANERIYGTLGPVLLSTGSRGALWAGRAVPYIINAFAVMLFTLACGSLLLGARLPFSSLGFLIVAMIAGSFACTAFGIVIGAMGLRFRNVNGVANLALIAFILTSGAEIPLGSVPGWINAVGSYLPLTNAIRAARSSADGAGAMSVMPTVGREALIGLGYSMLAAVLLRYFESRSRGGLSLDAV